MAWLNFLKNGNALGEMLIVGANPRGATLLKHADVDQLRDHLRPTERVQAYVLGRVVQSGRGLWLLTDQHLLVSENASGSLVHRFALQDISHAECVKGKYGFTLRVTAAGQSRSVYGATRPMAAVFFRALGQKMASSPLVQAVALTAEEVAEVVHHFCDAALRLQPVAMAHAHADAQALIAQWAQDAAADGGLLASDAKPTHLLEKSH